MMQRYRFGHLFAAVLPLLLLLSTTARGDGFMDGSPSNYPGRWLPMFELNTKIDVVDQVVNTTIDMSFYNETQNLVDATFFYPVPDEATVTGFGVWVDDSIYYFEIEPGEQGGVGDGDPLDPYILDYLGDNMFIENFVDLEPGIITLRLEYTELMDYEFGLYQFTYPLDQPTFADMPIGQTTLELSGSSNRELLDVTVPDYPGLEFDVITADSFHASLNEINAQFELPLTPFIEVNQEDVGMWVMSRRNGDLPGPGHVLAILDPGTYDPDDGLQKSFTFVMDKSGSMSGQPILEAKEAATYCIENLSNDDFLNVISFDGTVHYMNLNPVPATDANKAAAVQWINNQDASGSTNLNAALLGALNQNLQIGNANQILLLSDGLPTEGETDLPDILANVSEANDIGASIFTVAAGPAADLAFLDLIGFENAGLSIQVDDLANLAEEIEVFFQRFSSPVRTHVTIQGENISFTEVYPPAPYTIFAGSQTIIAAQYPEPGTSSITMNYTVAGNQESITYGPFEFTADDSTTYGFVPRMWAIRKIDYLLAYMAVYGEDPQTINTIIQLSLQYGILTPYTGFNTPVEETHHLHVNATRAADGVRVSWDLAPELPGVEFDVYRRESTGRAFLKLTREPVAGRSFTDITAESGVSYVYKVVPARGDVAVAPAEVRVDADYGDLVRLTSATPNPFNASTVVEFTLAREMDVTLTVHDILGRQVARLAHGRQPAGRHDLVFDGSRLASGVYFVRLDARLDNQALNRTARILLMK